MSLLLRRAVDSDVRRVFEWRNHETVRRSSLYTGELDWKGHQNWFLNSLKNPDRHILIGERDHVPIGVLRFDVAGNQAEISIFTDPNLTGQGLGSQLLQQGVIWCKQHIPALRELVAKVRQENLVSMRLFEKTGFTVDVDEKECKVYTLKL